MYEDRICPTCGVTFTPNKKRQIYHDAKCRVKAHRHRKQEAAAPAPLGSAELLSSIQKVDPETARDIEQLALVAGNKVAEQVLLVCWRAMNRAAWRYAKEAIKQELIESGEVKEVKRRGPKKRDSS